MGREGGQGWNQCLGAEAVGLLGEVEGLRLVQPEGEKAFGRTDSSC